MKTLKRKVCVVMLAIVLVAGSCSKEVTSNPDLNLPSGLSPENLALKVKLEQRSLITTAVMKDKEIVKLFAKAVKNKIAFAKMNEEAITFKEILDEQPAYISEFSKKFKEKFGEIYYAHNYFRANKFPIPFQPVSLTKSGNSIALSQIYNDLFSDNDGTQIYFPYSENFEQFDNVSPAITYYPFKEVEDVEAYQNDGIQSDNVFTFMANESYAKSNPTFVLNINEIGNIKSPFMDTTLTNPVNPIQTNRLQNNILSDSLDDKYVLSVFIPKVKLLKNFRTWLGGSNYFVMIQCYAKPNYVEVNPQTLLNPIGVNQRYVCKDFNIRRKYVGNWVDFNLIFNDDWKLEQFDNPMLIYSKQGWFYNTNGEANINVTAGLRIDSVRNNLGNISYQLVPTFNAGASIGLKVILGPQYEFRGSDYITRRGMLANIVNNNFGNGTLEYENANYTVRKIGDCLQYAFVVNESH
jgi:hypothetical protein